MVDDIEIGVDPSGVLRLGDALDKLTRNLGESANSMVEMSRAGKESDEQLKRQAKTHQLMLKEQTQLEKLIRQVTATTKAADQARRQAAAASDVQTAAVKSGTAAYKEQSVAAKAAAAAAKGMAESSIEVIARMKELSEARKLAQANVSGSAAAVEGRAAIPLSGNAMADAHLAEELSKARKQLALDTQTLGGIEMELATIRGKASSKVLIEVRDTLALQNAMQGLSGSTEEIIKRIMAQGVAFDTAANKADAYQLALRKVENTAIVQKLNEEIAAYKRRWPSWMRRTKTCKV